MSLQQLVEADPRVLADLVPHLLSQALERPDGERLRTVTSVVRPEEWDVLMPMLLGLGQDHKVYAAHPGLRRVSRVWMADLLLHPRITGSSYLVDAVASGPTILVTNHLAYVDANAKDALLALAVGPQIADRVVYLAGPKVYSDPFRRVSCAAINSLPVPQSSRLHHNETPLPARELALRALRSVEASQAHLEGGGLVVFYPEGSRSRTGRMGSFFQATRRYLKSAVTLVPAALVGTDKVMPVGERIRPANVELHFAPPISLETTSARDALHQAFEAIAARLPPSMQPEPGTVPLQ